MKLRLVRDYKTFSTVGMLYIDGEYFCDTLEDKKREVKIKGETCIPEGTYKVLMNVTSMKYVSREQYAFCKGKLPRLVDVPNFEGILIHIGNTIKDTEGCILVGKHKNSSMIINSTATMLKLYEKLKTAKEDITIKICNTL